MSRRPNPTPIPYTARDGTRTWRIRYRLDGRNSTETFDTKREAQDFGADIRDFGPIEAVKRLTERDRPAHHGPTLDDVFTQFIAWNTSRVKSSRTIEEYEHQWAVIAPAIGAHRPIDDITEDDVQRWVDAMTAGKVGARTVKGKHTPLSPKTIANRHGLLHSVFKYAAARGQRYIATNPCTETELPKRRRGMPKGLRPGEWAALHAALCQIDPDAADLALALYASGARFGEITALETWSVEDDGRRVTLTIDHVNRRMAGGRYEIVEDTKSEAGFRRVQIGAGASAMIRRRVLAAGQGGLVFTNRHGRVWLHTTFYTSWDRAVEVANLSRRPTMHWLRHTHVQELLDRGLPLQVVQARVGHENISTTIGTYARLQRGAPVDVLDSLDLTPQIETGPTITGELA
jgi:site-specific recombinase XerD